MRRELKSVNINFALQENSSINSKWQHNLASGVRITFIISVLPTKFILYIGFKTANNQAITFILDETGELQDKA